MIREDLDYLCLVVLKNGTERTPFQIVENGETSTIISEPRLIFDFQKILKKQLKYNSGYLYASYQLEEVFIQETRESYQIHFRGYFFLFPDYREKLAGFVGILNHLHYRFHLTRLDHAITFLGDWERFSSLLIKSKVSKDLTISQYKKAGEFSYVSIFHSRMKVVAYNKQRALKQRKIKNEYKALYKEKYGQSNIRMEIRLFQKDTLKTLTEALRESPEDFFKSYKSFTMQYFNGRVKTRRGLFAALSRQKL